MKKRQGFTMVEGVIVLALLVIIGAVGYVYAKNLFFTTTTQTNSSSVPAATVKTITSASDINTVSSQLDKLSLSTDGNSDLSALEAELNKF